MQVTLTARAEELLREALAHSPAQSPEEMVERALQECLSRIGNHSLKDPVARHLNQIPGIGQRLHWPPYSRKFEPVNLEGEPLSEQLIRERR